jgi:hypothetical protein
MRQFSERESELHTAKVLVREARVRRLMGQTKFAGTLLQWAANARKRAASAAERNKPAQGDLFGGK